MTLLSLLTILNKFKKEIVKINGFSVELWMVISLVFMLIMLMLVTFLYIKQHKKNILLKNTTEIEDIDIPLETITIISKEEIKNYDEKSAK